MDDPVHEKVQVQGANSAVLFSQKKNTSAVQICDVLIYNSKNFLLSLGRLTTLCQTYDIRMLQKLTYLPGPRKV